MLLRFDLQQRHVCTSVRGCECASAPSDAPSRLSSLWCTRARIYSRSPAAFLLQNGCIYSSSLYTESDDSHRASTSSPSSSVRDFPMTPPRYPTLDELRSMVHSHLPDTDGFRMAVDQYLIEGVSLHNNMQRRCSCEFGIAARIICVSLERTRECALNICISLTLLYYASRVVLCCVIQLNNLRGPDDIFDLITCQ
jgi:hypothetical protein